MTATLSPQFLQAREKFAAWYDAKPSDVQELIDEISDRTHYIIDEDQYDTFIAELSDLGITDASTFEDAIFGEFEGYGERVLTEFAENYVENYMDLDRIPDMISACIDYNQLWYYALQHDFNVVEFNGNTYFFWNHY